MDIPSCEPPSNFAEVMIWTMTCSDTDFDVVLQFSMLCCLCLYWFSSSGHTINVPIIAVTVHIHTASGAQARQGQLQLDDTACMRSDYHDFRPTSAQGRGGLKERWITPRRQTGAEHSMLLQRLKVD